MVVLPVDDGDLYRRSAQLLRGFDTAESCADYYDFDR
jgi:hypothetical protein